MLYNHSEIETEKSQDKNVSFSVFKKLLQFSPIYHNNCTKNIYNGNEIHVISKEVKQYI